LKLNGEDLLVPPGIERELVVGKDVGAPLGRGEMRQRERGNGLPLEQLCRFYPAMSRDDLAIVRDQYRVSEPEPLDGRCDLLDLLFGMRARVTRIWLERSYRPLDNACCNHVECPLPKKRTAHVRQQGIAERAEQR